MADQVQRQDELRTERNFISLLSGALGINDQSYAGTDSVAYSPPGQFQSINPQTGAVAVEGTSISSTQQQAQLLPMLGLLAALALGFFVLKAR